MTTAMTNPMTTRPSPDDSARVRTLAQPAGFGQDVTSVATRALRQILRDPEAVIPSLFVGIFFYAVQVGVLQDLVMASSPGGLDFKAFLLPMGIVFAITGVSRAAALVTDIQSGYFDRLLVTPIRRTALLLGLMIADLVLVLVLASLVSAAGLLFGVRFVTGPLGFIAFLGLCALWGLAFAGFPYAVALRTGNPAAVNASFLLFMPFAFLSTAFVPRDAMTGWMAEIVQYNPVTYLLEALRALLMVGWDVGVLAQGIGAVGAVFVVTLTLSALALRGRVSRA